MLQGKKYHIDMERGSYSRLDQIDHIQIELTEQPPASLADETSGLHKSSNTHEKHIDYVLVYESQKDVSELDDESLEERRKLAAWRYSFERCLVNKLGLILQHKTVIIGEVNKYKLKSVVYIYLEAKKAIC